MQLAGSSLAPNLMKSIVISDRTFACVAKLAEVFGMPAGEYAERLLDRYFFESLPTNELNIFIAEDAEEIVCPTRSDAKALADRLESFANQARKIDPGERLIRASAVKYNDGWGVKTVCTRSDA
jgi:hypothetical protein